MSSAVIASGILVLVSSAAVSAIENDPASIQAAYERGNYRLVVETLEQSSPNAVPTIHSAEQIRWLLMHADSYRKLGMHAQSAELLLAVRPAIEQHEQVTESHALYYGRLGEAHRLQANPESALEVIQRGLGIARQVDSAAAESSLQNDLGNLYASVDDTTQAAEAYRASLAAATAADDESLTATAAINLARAKLHLGNAGDIRKLLGTAGRAIASTPENAGRLAHHLALGKLYESAQDYLGYASDLRLAASEHYRRAMRLAEHLGDRRSLSYALGYLGGLYETEQRFDESQRLTTRAIEFAREVDAEGALYQWEWQRARLHVHEGDMDEALAAYRRAMRSVRAIRDTGNASAARIYREYVGSLYFEMADLLLQRTSTLESENEIQANLLEVRQTLESLKTAEIVDYFDNECVIQAQDRAALEQLSSTAAVIYPVLMDDRLELLISFPGDIRQVSVPVGREELTREVRRLRLGIENVASGDRFLSAAQQLYDWIVRPLESHLANADVDTLVFVPDGPLRTIPMSVLHSGDNFLVEEYSLATTPGISLTSADGGAATDTRVLANGITHAVQGFSALPNVEEELRSIGELYPTRVNQNENFELISVERSISEGEYSIVHIATHGQFDSDHRNSFLLTYDDKMTMNRLEEVLNLRRFQEEAIELLVLSACQTAAGDDRAALGMAGVALKAGARSALATLWFINDASTSTLMQDFYKNLQGGNTSKARALQLAQVKMMADPEHRHPAHWAPFLLIGNWL